MVSIVVPVYNAEKYLEDCLISLVDQTYENIEIILVDDGSVDDSGRICDCWAEKDDRIIVYHKKNEGVSATRNFGIQRARGKFLMFVDADDMLVLNAVEYMVKEIIKNNSELVVCKYQSQDYEKNIRESNLRIELLLKEDYLREMMIPEKNIAAFVYNRLYLTQIIMEKNIRFNQNVQVCEDTLFNYEYMKFIKNVVCSSSPRPTTSAPSPARCATAWTSSSCPATPGWKSTTSPGSIWSPSSWTPAA